MGDRYGIYFNLGESDYHADPALGSTDLKRLLASGPDYWYWSPLNPDAPQRELSPFLIFGRAIHKIVLEGSQAFHSRYVRRPDGIDRLTPKRKAVISANGEDILDGDDYDRIMVSAGLIAQNPDLAAAFEGGMPEVSVFWEHLLDGEFVIRCKARFDYLKIRGIGDLKSIRNIYGAPFAEACTRSICNFRYDIQAAHYLEGRSMIGQFVRDNQVYGDYDAAWLNRVAAAPSYAFQWVFFQAEGAPITWSKSLSPGNPILDIAERDRYKAMQTYRDFSQKVPAGQMWLSHEPVEELNINNMPSWYR
jgi:hypothetical protein